MKTPKSRLFRNWVVFLITVSGVFFFAARSAVLFHREWSLRQSHAVIDARAVQVTSRKSPSGCTTNVWIEFEPPRSGAKYSYLGDFYFSNRPTPIGFWDPDDSECARTQWDVGDTIQMAYVPRNPKINRAYWGTLERGIGPDEWKDSAGLAAFIAILGIWAYWDATRKRTP